MPELPEVECLTRAVRKVALGATLLEARFLRKDLREPIPIKRFRALLENHSIDDVTRRSKYLLMKTRSGYGIFHLGMTGNMYCLKNDEPELSHTHAIFTIRDAQDSIKHLHFVDPRRFGRIDCVSGHNLDIHAFFRDLGPEPLSTRDLGDHLYHESRGRKAPIKTMIMDARVVVGVGNIYASEALFHSGICPTRPAGSLDRDDYVLLANKIKNVLKAAIKAGGTTFRDFRNVDGNPGYFRVKLAVYDKAGEACGVCGESIKHLRQSGRSTFFCPVCQK